MPAARLRALLQRRIRAVRHSDAGFTVLEAVVALTVFVTFSVAATMAVVGGIRANSDTRNRVAASNIAQADLEQARALPSPTSAAYTTSAPGDSAAYSVDRSVSACSSGLSTVSVTVSGPGQDVTIETVIAC